MSVIPKSNGHLLCEECGTYWCLHVEQVVKDGTDKEFIWDNYPDPVQLEIPIVPTANLWATALLERPDDSKFQLYKVVYSPDVINTEHIGYVYPSEGRSVIRAMILDWFIGTKDPFIGQCTSSGHGYKQTMKYLQDDKTLATRIVQHWSIWATGKCLGCTFDIKNNPDLVPDPGPTKSPWMS